MSKVKFRDGEVACRHGWVRFHAHRDDAFSLSREEVTKLREWLRELDSDEVPEYLPMPPYAVHH
jgi:hypothetical protein